MTVLCSAPNFPTGKVYPGYKNRWRHVEEVDGIRVVRVKTFIAKNEGFGLRMLDYVSYFVSAFAFAFCESKPDVAISTSPHLFAAAAGALHCKLRGIQHIFEVRDLWPASIQALTGMKPGFSYRMLEKLELFLYRISKRILTLTPSLAEDIIARGVPREKTDVVINGANLDLFCPRRPDPAIQSNFALQNRFVVGYLGTIGMAHGLENVIETAKLLRSDPIVFFFVGVGAALEPLRRLVEDNALNNVIFAGRQMKEDMPAFWSVCNLSLIHLKDNPLFEGAIPSKIFESMASGVPILYVGPKSEGARIVEKHNAGIYIPPADPAALAKAIRDLSSDTETLSSFAKNSLEAAPLYSREAHAQKTLVVLEKARSV